MVPYVALPLVMPFTVQVTPSEEPVTVAVKGIADEPASTLSGVLGVVMATTTALEITTLNELVLLRSALLAATMVTVVALLGAV